MSSSPWSPEVDLLSCTPESVATGRPRLAKDASYAADVQAAWRSDVAVGSAGNAVGRPFPYEAGGTVLYGHVVRPSSSSSSTTSTRTPGVILFHTGAGPQDIFLRWKADVLASTLGCTVLIADVLSDDTGWAWGDDRARYHTVRRTLKEETAPGERGVLRQRIRAARAALTHPNNNVDPDRVAVLGWCLGGQAALELLAMGSSTTTAPRLRALATFHGVFDGVREISSLPPVWDQDDHDTLPRVLVCHGADDPFVPAEDLTCLCDDVLSDRYDYRLLTFPGVRHGFTNPAQDRNPSPAFAFDRHAADKSWAAVCDLLRETIL